MTLRQITCPLCGSGDIATRARAHGRSYLSCARCQLVFVSPEQRLDDAAERAYYGLHQNDPRDTRYRAFLDRLATPLVAQLSPGASGLDYGSGPGPTLSVMLAEQGFPMSVYDPYFAPDRDVLTRTYDFITCTETAEHFFHPGEELEHLDQLLRPNGWLGLMTELLDPEQALESWRYARDPTHVCLYGAKTMRWIGDHFDWSQLQPRPNVILFHKPPPPRREARERGR